MVKIEALSITRILRILLNTLHHLFTLPYFLILIFSSSHSSTSTSSYDYENNNVYDYDYDYFYDYDLLTA
jgi:hypothetical protein